MVRNYLRVRGEYYTEMMKHDYTRELPPRARRIQPKTTQSVSNSGTTSACAENTLNELGLL